jgi:hypothetical protein
MLAIILLQSFTLLALFIVDEWIGRYKQRALCHPPSNFTVLVSIAVSNPRQTFEVAFLPFNASMLSVCLCLCSIVGYASSFFSFLCPFVLFALIFSSRVCTPQQFMGALQKKRGFSFLSFCLCHTLLSPIHFPRFLYLALTHTRLHSLAFLPSFHHKPPKIAPWRYGVDVARGHTPLQQPQSNVYSSLSPSFYHAPIRRPISQLPPLAPTQYLSRTRRCILHWVAL